MTKLLVVIALAAVSSSLARPQQQQQQQAPLDYDYIYDDVLGTPDFQQPIPQAPVVEARPRSRQPAQAQQPVRQQVVRQQTAGGPNDAETTTYIPILKESRITDPVTGAFIYDYMGADGSGKYEVRFLNGTVLGNFTYINDIGERETRWYSAGKRGTEISGDSVISPAPPTLVDETTGANYVDLSNYDLYRHLEVPYVHIAGPSDPNERGQLSAQDDRRFQDARAQPSRPRQEQVQQQQQQQPSQVPIDFSDDTRFAAQPDELSQQPLESQRPSRVSRTRVRVVDNAAPTPTQSRPAAQFDASALDTSSPNNVLDSLIRQFQ